MVVFVWFVFGLVVGNGVFKGIDYMMFFRCCFVLVLSGFGFLCFVYDFVLC